MLKASHIILRLLTDKIQVNFVIKGNEQEHDTAPTRIWEDVTARLRKLGGISLVAKVAYETAPVEITHWDTTFYLDVHFADLGANNPPSILIDMTHRSAGSHFLQFDSPGQIEPAQEWLRIYGAVGVT